MGSVIPSDSTPLLEQRPRGWLKTQRGFLWFSDEDSPQDRRVIAKLDILILPFAFLSCWTKYIDQANLHNAYVSGMKEDLGFYGNELIQLQTLSSVGAVVGQLPFMFILPLVPMHFLLPTLDLAWGFFTLLQFRASSFSEIAVYRFFIGGFEAAFFPAMHFILGSWYCGHEIGRRGGIFYVGNTLGTITASMIQASASAGLEGVGGLAGWRWMYIMCALITIPIGLLGYLVLPGTPSKPNLLFLTKQDLVLRQQRLEQAGHAVSSLPSPSPSSSPPSSPTEKVTMRTIRQLGGSVQFWMLLALNVVYWNASLNTTVGGHLLWLKSLGRYSKAEINALGTIVPTIGIFYILLISFISDTLLGPAWAITVAHAWSSIGLVILVIWDVPEPALWFAFMTTFASVSMSSVLYGWVNHQLRASPAKRSFTLVFINLVAQVTIVWTRLVTFPTVEAPRFTMGYSFVLGSSILLISITQYLKGWLERHPEGRL